MKSNPAPYTAIAIAVQVVGVGILSIIACAICVWLPWPFWAKALFTFSFSILGWSNILFKTPGMKTPLYAYWFITNQPLHARVVGKILLTSNKSSDTHRVDPTSPLMSFDPSSLREIGPGWHGILPWERTVRVLDLQAHILIGNDFDRDPLVIQSKNKIPVELSWLTRLSALQGYLVNTVQFSDAGQIKEFRAIFTTFLLGWGTQHTDDEIFAAMKPENQEALRKEFKKLLGGKDKLHKFEKERGMFSGDPMFNGARYQKEYLDARQATAKAEQAGEARKALTAGFTEEERKKLNPNVAMLLGASMSGGLGNLDPIILVGDSDDGKINKETLAAAIEVKKQRQQKPSHKK